MSSLEEALDRVLFVGGHGYVTAIDKESGEEIWRTNLKGSGYGFVNLVLEKDQLFAASGGRLYALSAESGGILWMNPMPGLGYGVYTFATTSMPGGNVAPLAARMASSRSTHQASHS